MKIRKVLAKTLPIFGFITLPFATSMLTSCGTDMFSVPTINIYGDISKISKANEVPVSISFSDIDGLGFKADAKIKLQGQNSVYKKYPKQNFSISLYQKNTDFSKDYNIKINDKWDALNKYVLKANYIDNLGCHNIVSGKLWGDVVRQSKSITELLPLVNCGGIDGFPVACYINDRFWGFYTWNLKKNKNLFHMKKDENVKHAIFNTAYDGKSDLSKYKSWFFHKTIDDIDGEGWEIDFCSTKDDSWVKASFNDFISSVMGANSFDSFLSAINDHSNLAMLLNYYVFLTSSAAWDNTANNSVWITFDGLHWVPSFYDGDFTFGFLETTMIDPKIDFDERASNNLLFDKLIHYCHNDIKSTYWILREGSLSTNNVLNKYSHFMDDVTNQLLSADYARWGTRFLSINNMQNLKNFIIGRFKYLDKYYEK